MKNIESGIYQIRNLINQNIYVGSTVKYASRFYKHAQELNSNKHHSRYLQNAWNKYGKDNFIFEVLEKVKDRNVLIEREQHFIDTLKPVYNMSLKAGSCKPGEYNPAAKLNWEQIREIRNFYNKNEITLAFLAEKYGVDHSMISRIIFNVNWYDPEYSPPLKSKLVHGKRAKLNREQASEIRKKYKTEKITQMELASLYGVSRGCILNIIRNDNWKDKNWSYELVKRVGHSRKY